MMTEVGDLGTSVEKDQDIIIEHDRDRIDSESTLDRDRDGEPDQSSKHDYCPMKLCRGD